jgi:hypothetical protein
MVPTVALLSHNPTRSFFKHSPADRGAAAFGNIRFATPEADGGDYLVREAAHYEAIVLDVELNVVEIAVTIKGTEMARPATIKPTSTAYSTAVGPSSLDKKPRTLPMIVYII